MNKFMKLICCLFLFLFTGISTVHAQHDGQSGNCQLPPPQNLFITDITPSTLTFQWSVVPGAALYKLTIFDQTDQVALPDTYTPNTSANIDGLVTDAHEYLIGVSATGCVNGGEYGEATSIEYKPGIIIIVDIIVQRSSTDPVNQVALNSGQTQQIALPFNAIKTDSIETVRIQVTSNENNNEPSAEFLVWVDCFQQIRFHQLDASRAKFLPNGDQINYINAEENTPFFDIIKGECDINMCNIIIKSHVNSTLVSGTCYIDINEESCGDKKGDSMRTQSDGDNTPASVAHQKESTQREDHRLVAEMKVAPNPFSDALHIEFSLHEPAQISMSIFNATGVEVQPLLTLQWVEKGAYATDFQILRTLPSGVYFLVTNTGRQRTITPVVKH